MGHNFTIADVEKDGFDLSLLKIAENEILDIGTRFAEAKKIAEERNKKLNPNYYYVSTDSIVREIGLDSEPLSLSYLFHVESLLATSQAIDGPDMSYPNWSLTQTIHQVLQKNPKLAIKAFYCETTYGPFRDYVVSINTLPPSELLKIVRNKMVLGLGEACQLKLLELCDGSDAPIFFESDHEKIRLAAYKKHGPVLNLDAMIADSNWSVRGYSISILEPGDKRLASFISDKSLNVFCAALQKIDPGLMLMMVGSYHMKKSRAKEIVKQRLDSNK